MEQASYNILLGIGIPELLINLVSCHGFTEKPNSTVIFNCQYHLVNNSLAKGFVIIKQKSKQLSSVTNDVKLIIHAIYQQKVDFVMEKTTAIFLV